MFIKPNNIFCRLGSFDHKDLTSTSSKDLISESQENRAEIDSESILSRGYAANVEEISRQKLWIRLYELKLITERSPIFANLSK